MKDKMTITLICTLIIGLVYFNSFSIESSKNELEVSDKSTPINIEYQLTEFINKEASETEILDKVELEIGLSTMNFCVLEKMDTDLLPFSKAFSYFRQCLGSDSSFQWKGLEYTTLLSEEVIINLADSLLIEEKSKDTEISQVR